MKGLITNHIGTTYSKQGAGFLSLGLPSFMAGACKEDTRSDFFLSRNQTHGDRL